jgi:DDE_Tnp_1-associated
MSKSAMATLKDHFSQLNDPRAQHSIEHLLIDIVLMTMCAVICGAENWAKLTTIGCVESQRCVGEQTTCETRYYLLSLPLDAGSIRRVGAWSLGD